MNAPNPAELFVLEDGEKPVEVTEDTKIPNAATFKIVKQDHTLGNMLRAQLLSMPQVLFAGYKVPHPLHPYFIIKVQTDGSITPQDVVEKATKDLIGMLSGLEAKFRKEFQFKEMEATGVGVAPAGQPDDPYGSLGGGEWGAATGPRGDYLDL